MASATIHLALKTFFAVHLCLFLPRVSSLGFMDIEDLKNSQLDISIQSKPVLLYSSSEPSSSEASSVSDDEENVGKKDADRQLELTEREALPENSLVLSSKYGQVCWVCSCC